MIVMLGGSGTAPGTSDLGGIHGACHHRTSSGKDSLSSSSTDHTRRRHFVIVLPGFSSRRNIKINLSYLKSMVSLVSPGAEIIAANLLTPFIC